MRLRLVVGEAVRSLRASMSTTVAATLTVLIGMFVLGLTIALGTWVISWSDHVKKELLVKVYFTNVATPKQIDRVRITLAKDAEHIKKYRFISRQAALVQMKKKYPELVKNLAYNPLPASYEIVPRQAEFISSITQELTPKPAGVDKVKNGGQTSKRILRVGKIV